MKKCPLCKSDIEDNARFCIYCMTSLEEKTTITPSVTRRRPWWWIPVVLLVLIAVVMFAVKDGVLPEQEDFSLQGETLPEQPSESEPEEQPSESEPEEQPSEPEPEEMPTEPEPEEMPTESEPEEQPSESEPEEQPSESTPEEQTQPTASVGNWVGTVVYSYRPAERYDELNVDYVNDGNDIVITGVETPAPDGVYEIPSHIDGKRVIAITAGAFSEAGSNAKKVVLPETVKCVWDHSFRGCALEEIYFTHNVYIQTNAFPDSKGMLTIYCPGDCHDRLFWSYSGNASSYGARWEEWGV